MLGPAYEKGRCTGVDAMKTLAAVLGAVTAITLLSGCAYDNRYDRYGYGYGYSDRYYYGDRYDRPNYYGRYDRDCWYDRDGDRHCVRR
jgi:hypothetical protein